MSINNVNNNGHKPALENQKLAQQQAQNTGEQAVVKQEASSQAVRQDSVSLTQSAQTLSQVQKKSVEAPVNQEKVDRLKQAVQNGEYSVNPQSLAKSIAAQELEIFGIN
ncbi:MAG: negative regulator of flagellin synthesis FlgM [Paraglaciecola sp.]|jgi:negative regulator of flagellin synthesis FlgM